MTTRSNVDREQVEAWAVTAARAADDKKGLDTVVLRVGDLLSITDAFVITSATNDRQVRSIAEEVEKQVKQSGGPSPLRIEGMSEARWILIDYGDFVVHVFLDETREFYNLERLWSDAAQIAWQDGSSAVNG
jgi:ribosome-associated protein